MRKLLLLLPLIFLSSCEVNPPGPGPAPDYRRYQPIYMKVSNIEVLEEYRSPMRPPNVEHTMPYSPADAMQIWVKQRLKAAGGDKTMQILIKDASVVGQELPTAQGLSGLFSNEPDHEYHARLEVEMRIYGSEALSEASINVVATRTLQMSSRENPSVRDQKFRRMMDEMMNTMNAELEKNMFQHLGTYVDFTKGP